MCGLSKELAMELVAVATGQGVKTARLITSLGGKLDGVPYVEPPFYRSGPSEPSYVKNRWYVGKFTVIGAEPGFQFTCDVGVPVKGGGYARGKVAAQWIRNEDPLGVETGYTTGLMVVSRFGSAHFEDEERFSVLQFVGYEVTTD